MKRPVHHVSYDHRRIEHGQTAEVIAAAFLVVLAVLIWS